MRSLLSSVLSRTSSSIFTIQVLICLQFTLLLLRLSFCSRKPLSKMSSNFYPVVGGAALHTVGILHYALPPFAAVYYFASVAIGAVRGKLQEGGSQVQETNKPKEDKGLMTVKLWSMTTVLITYVSFRSSSCTSSYTG